MIYSKDFHDVLHCRHCSHTLTLMRDLSQPVFPLLFGAVSDAVIIKVHHIFAVSAWIDAEGDRVHFALRIKLPSVLLQLPFGDNCSFSNVNGTVVSARVVPWGIEIELHPSINGSIKWHLVVCETIPLASRRKVHGTARLT